MGKAQDQIKAWVKHGGRKLSWLATQIPASPAQLSRWLNGGAVPIEIFRRRISEITGLDVTKKGDWE
mgnify:CR=1 FL=1